MRKFTADFIYTLESEPLNNAVVITDNEGKILTIEKLDNNNIGSEIERFNGVIVPGFINSHCHLELSHLHQQIPEGEGLVAFIKNVIRLRNFDEETQIKAAEVADKLMYKNGIVIVGDISNSHLTAKIKSKSKIKYHTFVEIFGIDGDNAAQLFTNALALKAQFAASVSITPHAPYSVSQQLFNLINSYSQTHANLITLHNQESQQENLLYQNKTGDFINFYKFLGIDIDSFKAQNKTSFEAILPLLSSHQKKLFVHNTYTCQNDIDLAKQVVKEIFWCFCPNANLYIENKLPPITQFLDTNFNITLGTDSLASNHNLCILAEMQTLLNYLPKLTFAQILPWATINGAKFFGFDNVLGSIKVGKTPGLNLITNFNNGNLTPSSKIIKLI